ncbi:hypothetical protein [Nonomuraea sp. SYSU D8015]|uniref:hypothetical protein n=1 Tax=Nonomuraea sp. SYSU D8015 TaxID=2593644 RepID=UPI001660C949|nr:hypothetical protein [Nonomuraea sp. SYSU D8015]
MTEARDLVPLSVGDLRRFLEKEKVPDHVPVIVGGVDFGNPGNKLIGMADDIWLDGDGLLRGRLVIGTLGLGLIVDGSTSPPPPAA